MSGEQGLIDELRALAGASGDHFAIAHGRLWIQVDYASGSSSGLTLSANYDQVARPDHVAIGQSDGRGTYRRSARAPGIVAVRPLAITLRTETGGDVAAKTKGINVEFQTGDEDFDRQVYIDSPTSNREVLAAVLGPKLRKGVLALRVLGFRSVEIDNGGTIAAYLSEFNPRTARPGRGKSAVEAFALVLSDLPRLTASGGAHPALPIWARGSVLLVAAILVVGGGGPTWCAAAYATNCIENEAHDQGELSESLRDACGAPTGIALLVGLVAGLAAAVLARVLATPVLRGRSDAATRITYVRITAFLLVFVVTTIVVSTIGFSNAHR